MSSTSFFKRIKDILGSAALESLVADAANGLPSNTFMLLSRLLPLVNVELVIRNQQNEIALLWRERSSDVAKAGWHLPGGIMRIGESIEERVLKTAKEECGIAVKGFYITSMSETVIDVDMPRRHFISFVIECCEWSWLSTAAHSEISFYYDSPRDLIENHRRYESLFGKPSPDEKTELIRDITFERGFKIRQEMLGERK